MARRARVRREQADALIESALMRARGEGPLDARAQQRRAGWIKRAGEVGAELAQLVTGRTRKALTILIHELTARSIKSAERADELEARLAAIEARLDALEQKS